jgi:hypothetical protein
MPPARRWLGRAAACLVLVLGVLALEVAIEAASAALYGIAALGLGSALAFIFGIERPSHGLSAWARPLGWAGMLVFSLFPAALLFVPSVIVLLALPAAFAGRLTRGTGASASPAPGPS